MFKKVYVEITNSCNLNCSFCHGNKRVKSFISEDKFKELLDKLEGYTDYLYFHVMGEPLLHPKINELINIASERYHINITTNGYMIDKIKDNKNIRQVNISLHSYDKKLIDIDDYLNKVFDAVDSLVKKDTYISYRLWVDSVDKNDIINRLENKYHVVIGDSEHIKLSDNVYFDVEEEFIWPSMDNDYYCEKGSCMGCRSHIGILVDGTVVPCCLDSEGVINLGNIYKTDIDGIINSALFKELKEGFLNNKKVHPLCRKCNFYELRR